MQETISFLDAHKKTKLNEKTRMALGLSKDTKIALYAPTFRDNGDTSAIQLNYPSLKKSLEEKFQLRFKLFY